MRAEEFAEGGESSSRLPYPPSLGHGADVQDEVLEALEQQLIQHLRTTGVRKQREVELINEVMNIRRERRKSFAGVRSLVRRLEEDNREIRDRCTTLARERESEMISRKALMAHAVHKNEAELSAISRQHEAELAALKEKFTQVNKLQLVKISKVYEEKLRAVDDKLQQLDAARQVHDQRTAQAIAAEMTDRAVTEVTTQHQAKLQKYKEALRSVAEKERDALQALQQCQSRLQDAEQDKRIIGDKLRKTEEYLGRFHEKEKFLKATIDDLKGSLETAQAQLVAVKTSSASQQNQFDEAIAIAKDHHTAELEEVDAKVRKALQSRDEKIKILQEKLSRAEQAQAQAEQILAEINDGIGTTKRPPMGRR
jgi:hypothetical protein